MKVYFPKFDLDKIGGCWTFVRNLMQGLSFTSQPLDIEMVDNWQTADIYFIPGVTMVERNEVEEAKTAGKKIVLRMDNIPRKSRNKRCRVYDNLRRYAEIADVVVYQSEWARDYCYPLTGEGTVIYNGVNTKIFYPADNKPKTINQRVLFAYHGKSELKNFWQAHLHFQYFARTYPNAEFWFIYDFGRDQPILEAANFDFWQGEKYVHYNQVKTPQEMAFIMRNCTHFFYPSIADAAPNILLEAVACGLEACHLAPKELAGSQEIYEDFKQNGVRSIETMALEYFNLFKLLVDEKEICLSTNNN